MSGSSAKEWRQVKIDLLESILYRSCVLRDPFKDRMPMVEKLAICPEDNSDVACLSSLERVHDMYVLPEQLTNIRFAECHFDSLGIDPENESDLL